MLPSYGFTTADEPGRTGVRAIDAELAGADAACAGIDDVPAGPDVAVAGADAELAGFEAAIAGTAAAGFTSLGRRNWTRIVKFATLR